MKKDKAVRKAEFKAAAVKQLKSLIGPMIVLLLIVAAVVTIMLWPETVEEEKVVELRGFSGTETEYVLENDKLKFVMDAATTQFNVTVKETGEVWYSNPQGAAEDPIAFTMEKNKMQSTLLLTYSTINGVDTLYNNYEHSMTNQLYEVEQGEDYIRVDYSIGEVEREYIFPVVMTEERYKEYLNNATGSPKNMLSQFFKKYDINKLSRSDEKIKDELLERFPLMAETVIYAIRDDANRGVRTKLEDYFTNELGYTYEEYLVDKAEDHGTKTSDKPVFNVSMIYRLDGEDLMVEVPYDSFDYVEDYPVYQLSILPYFGAAGTEDEGFLFVPEGGGAIINFNNGKIAQNSYYADIYGWDMCIDRDAIVRETRTAYNVFGAAKGDSAFLCIIEGGAASASVRADISGRNGSYNYVNALFGLLKREQYDVSSKYNGEMFVYEKALPAGESMVQRYRFVDSNNYVDMAKAYQAYLLETETLTKKDTAEAPVLIEIIGAVDKIKQVLGVPVSKPLTLTTFEEATGLVQEFKAAGMNELSVKLTGWANGGVKQKMLEKIKVVKQLGNEKELKNLVNTAADLGISFYLDGITDYAIDSDFFEGFIGFVDAARYISKEKAELYEYSTTTYAKRDDLDEYYLLNAEQIQKMTKNLTDKTASYGAGVSFANIGKELSSDFTKKNPTSRENILKNQVATLSDVSQNQKVLINYGNVYAVPYADLVTNMNLAGSEYTILDAQVPFYQLALHGYVNYTGEALNLTKNVTDELLRSAEYGAGLAFTVMQESPFTLQNTLYTQYFGSEYDACNEDMYATYNRYNSELGHVFNQEMVNHESLAPEVKCTTYEDGTKVYVNYSHADYTTNDGTIVPARDYIVTR